MGVLFLTTIFLKIPIMCQTRVKVKLSGLSIPHGGSRPGAHKVGRGSSSGTEGEVDSRLEAQMAMLRFILPKFISIWLGFFKLQT